MSTKARTVDNLGVDVSIQYAKNMEQLDRKLLEESRAAPFQTDVVVTNPYVLSEWDDLFSMRRKHGAWAQFFAPPHFTSHRKNLFSYQLIPSMGTPERHQAEAEKLKHFQFRKHKKKKKKEEAYEERDDQQEEKERDILLTLLEKIMFLDKQILFVNSRRSQYQKG